MTRREAIREARGFADETVREALKGLFGIIDKAIDLRRYKPMRFALFHMKMKEYREGRGHPARANWHAFWEARYRAKAYALDRTIAKRCGLAESEVV